MLQLHVTEAYYRWSNSFLRLKHWNLTKIKQDQSAVLSSQGSIVFSWQIKLFLWDHVNVQCQCVWQRYLLRRQLLSLTLLNCHVMMSDIPKGCHNAMSQCHNVTMSQCHNVIWHMSYVRLVYRPCQYFSAKGGVRWLF